MNDSELVTVFSTTSEGIAEVVRLRLDEDGIPAQVTGAAQGGFAGVLQINVVVRAEDAERAKSIIAEHQANVEATDDADVDDEDDFEDDDDEDFDDDEDDDEDDEEYSDDE